MRRLFKIMAGAVLGVSLFGGTASAQSISGTGPGSTNTITNSQSCSVSISNNNNVNVSSNNSQSSTSGGATSSGNTSGGNASSGNAGNSSSVSIGFGISNGTAGIPCVPGTTPGNGGGGGGGPTPGGGRGGGGIVPSSQTMRIAALPNTGETKSPVAGALISLAVITAGTGLLSRLLYRRLYL